MYQGSGWVRNETEFLCVSLCVSTLGQVPVFLCFGVSVFLRCFAVRPETHSHWGLPPLKDLCTVRNTPLFKSGARASERLNVGRARAPQKSIFLGHRGLFLKEAIFRCGHQGFRASDYGTAIRSPVHAILLNLPTAAGPEWASNVSSEALRRNLRKQSYLERIPRMLHVLEDLS